MGFQRMFGCVWEKKGLTCYQSDAMCIRAGESMEWRDSLILPIYKEE